eukprot:NODE_5570_length_1756_cov_5.418662.p2 GENE.NODE_5570_length_1756_cov_5.418662~~NODE_5570_length_1756_cov_5.418662.p2  ORF type:complete len:221 (-),score=48.82 NODE_5570_length_1756_cov_5.418662:197-859(-)
MAPVLAADVPAGFEWAFRPRSHQGRTFETRVLTRHGVVVSSRLLRRGQTFDFRIPVPQRNRPVRVTVARRASASDKGCDDDDAPESVCSTGLPSPGCSTHRSSTSTSAVTVASPRGSIASTPIGGDSSVGATAASQAPSSLEPLAATICPHCLRTIAARATLPPGAVYATGAQCDDCGVRLLAPDEDGNGGGVQLFHCRACWLDFCHACAVREMTEVWWS